MTIKRGGKQLIALKLINEFPDDGVFEDLSGAIARECFSDEVRASEEKEPLSDSDKESNARHLMKYLVRYQCELDTKGGKKQTLQAQGRTILGYVNSLDHITKDPDTGETIRHRTFPNAGKGAIILRGPTKRKKPILLTMEQRQEKEVSRTTPARLEVIRKAARNLKASKATEEIKRLARAGAHQFAKPEAVSTKEVADENA